MTSDNYVRKNILCNGSINGYSCANRPSTWTQLVRSNCSRCGQNFKSTLLFGVEDDKNRTDFTSVHQTCVNAQFFTPFYCRQRSLGKNYS